MLISIEFKLDEAAIRETLEEGAVALSSSILKETGFYTPVRFLVGRENIFRHAKADYFSLPIIGFATEGTNAVDLICDGETREFSITSYGTLRLARSGAAIAISHSMSQKQWTAPLADIQRAFHDLRKRVARQLGEAAPQMLRHREWSTWFPFNSAF